MRVAHFSPLPPQQTGIADYCADLIPHLQQEMDLHVFSEENTNPIPTLHSPILPLSQFSNHRLSVDACLYHMGNHPQYHAAIWHMLQRYPGVVVLHDINLHAFYTQSSPAHFVREMGYERGIDGIHQARHHLHKGESINLPLVQRIADVSLGLIVHTSYAHQELQKITNTPITIIPLGTHLPALGHTAVSTPIRLGIFGVMAESKRLDQILQAIVKIKDNAPPFQLILSGPSIPEYPLQSRIKQYALTDLVTIQDYLSPEQFEAELAQIDIAINLRTGPTNGEMSATLVRLLAHGKPVLVSAVGGFAELPKTAVCHIPQDEQEVDHIATALLNLMHNQQKRQAIGQAARHYAENALNFGEIAKNYREFIEKIV